MLEKEYREHDFSGQDFSKQDLSHRKFIHCNFDRCNLSYADASYSEFTGCSMKQTNCAFTNFMMSSFQYAKFYPSDCYGMTMTFRCQTYKNMEISELWWYGYRMFSLLMIPENKHNFDLRDHDIGWMGRKYLELKKLFAIKEL